VTGYTPRSGHVPLSATGSVASWEFSLLVVGPRSYDEVVTSGDISKSDALGAIGWHNDQRPLWVPEVTGLSSVEAALTYAEAGWYVLPTHPADIKNPGSVVHGRWQDKSTRDPEQIRAWWRENPGNGIALHIGKSAAVAFDLDVDDLGVIARAGRPDIAEALRSAAAIQTTRCQGDRGHYLYATAPGESFGNGPGAFRRWGEVRGRNGVIIAAPTSHPDAKTKGGHYQWKRVGALRPLPEALRASLLAAADEADPLTRAELDEFLDTYVGDGCGREYCRNSPKGPVTRFNNQIVEGCSRHDTMASVLPWAFSEAMGGCYSAREAFEGLHKAFAAAFTEDDDPVRRNHLDNEFVRLAQWAAAHADPSRAHHNDQPKRPSRFAYRPQLARFARKKWRRIGSSTNGFEPAGGA
jgi:bifunctional DNA primase/polymerase-like protein